MLHAHKMIIYWCYALIRWYWIVIAQRRAVTFVLGKEMDRPTNHACPYACVFLNVCRCTRHSAHMTSEDTFADPILLPACGFGDRTQVRIRGKCLSHWAPPRPKRELHLSRGYVLCIQGSGLKKSMILCGFEICYCKLIAILAPWLTVAGPQPRGEFWMCWILTKWKYLDREKKTGWPIRNSVGTANWGLN